MDNIIWFKVVSTHNLFGIPVHIGISVYRFKSVLKSLPYYRFRFLIPPVLSWFGNQWRVGKDVCCRRYLTCWVGAREWPISNCVSGVMKKKKTEITNDGNCEMRWASTSNVSVRSRHRYFGPKSWRESLNSTFRCTKFAMKQLCNNNNRKKNQTPKMVGNL